MFPRLDFEHYSLLRDMDISSEDIDQNSWRLGQMASWSRWGAKTGDLCPITADDQSRFTQVLGPFSTQVVFFAINLGGKAIAPDLPDWRNFHTPGHRGDGTLKNTFARVEAELDLQLPAFYMTDVFKLVPTDDSSALDVKIRKDFRDYKIDHVERCARILRQELQICQDGAHGRPLTLVAMGDAAFGWLSGRDKDGKLKKDQRIAHAVDDVLGTGASKNVVRMDHYTFGSGTHESRTEVLVPLMKGLIQAD